ncbi:MAG: nucleoid occlusion factor SlmA [Burkholderiaceae bacterium]
MSDDATEATPPPRKRPKPGERRLQILQTLAQMLENPKGDRVTTALLAQKIEVSEAALYRHFASKAQMFEGLIEFIETTVFGLINQITQKEDDGIKQVRQIIHVLLKFSEQNKGMTRVLIGDALVAEDDRLQVRINQFVDRVEAAIKQSLRIAGSQGAYADEKDLTPRANLILSFVLGRWHRYAKSGFKASPTDHLEAQVRHLLG